MKTVAYLNVLENSSGPYWSYFNGWSADEKKDALAILTAAKATKHRVNVVTDKEGGCAIQTAGTNTVSLFLATKP